SSSESLRALLIGWYWFMNADPAARGPPARTSARAVLSDAGRVVPDYLTQSGRDVALSVKTGLNGGSSDSCYSVITDGPAYAVLRRVCFVAIGSLVSRRSKECDPLRYRLPEQVLFRDREYRLTGAKALVDDVNIQCPNAVYDVLLYSKDAARIQGGRDQDQVDLGLRSGRRNRHRVQVRLEFAIGGSPRVAEPGEHHSLEVGGGEAELSAVARHIRIQDI